MASFLAHLSIFIYHLFSKLQRNGSAILRYGLFISVQKLTQVIKSNTTNSLRIQRDSSKIDLLAVENTKQKKTRINWD